MAESFNERVAYWLRKQRMLPAAEIGVIAEGPNSLVPWQFLRVELKCLNPDGTADAYRLEWDEEEEEYAVDTSVSASELIKVRPFDGGSISGIGKDDVSEGQNGTRLWVIHPFDRGDNTPADDTWEPLTAAGPRMIKVANTYSGHAAVGGGATFSGKFVANLAGSSEPYEADDEVADITNYSVGIPDNATGIVCVWDDSLSSGDGGWLVIDAPCA